MSHANYAVMVLVATRSNWFETRDQNSSEFALSAQPSNRANIVSPARPEQPYRFFFNGRGLQASISNCCLTFFLSNSTHSAAEFGADELLLLFLFFCRCVCFCTILEVRTDRRTRRLNVRRDRNYLFAPSWPDWEIAFVVRVEATINCLLAVFGGDKESIDELQHTTDNR